MPKTFRNKENKGLQPFCSGDFRLMAGPGIKLYHRVAARISKILLTKEERPYYSKYSERKYQEKSLAETDLKNQASSGHSSAVLIFQAFFSF